MILPMIEATTKKALHTFPHELALAVVHDLLRDEGVVHHGIFPSCYWSYSASEQGSAHPQLKDTEGNDSLSEQTREDPDNIEKLQNWNCLFNLNVVTK